MNCISPIAATSASPPQFDPANIIIRFPEVEAITGLARATVYKRLKDDPAFPRPVSLSNSKSRGSPVSFAERKVSLLRYAYEQLSKQQRRITSPKGAS